MKYEEVKELVNNIIKNEYDHIQEGRQYNFENADKAYIALQRVADDLYNKLSEGINEEQNKQLDAYFTNMVALSNVLCKFYFKEGVKAGATNLNFAKSIGGYDIGGII
ncbi:MAG: hypothetical protein E6929_07780 [Clostridium sp.]|nr:hypothetical protein [Clostridium sp.]